MPVGGDRKGPEVSRWLKVTIVCAAAAFVVAFRFSADGNDADATSAPVTAERASAAVERPEPAPSAVRLARVAELPGLASEPASRAAAREKREAEARKARAAKKKAEAARSRRAAAKRKKEAAAAKRRAAAGRKAAAPARPRTAATPAPTVVRPAPTPVYRPPVRPAPSNPGGSYVGKGFDSEG
jgi:colicin import membrane protein